jgi:GNAT superfamily N-acetyltransferase
MMEPWVLELIGYVASVLVAISLMMSSLLRLRVINLLGSITFTVYGLMIQAYPVAAVNLFIVFVNLFYLHGMMRTREFFQLLEVRSDSEYLDFFLRFNAEEIRRFFPRFTHTSTAGSELNVFVLRGAVPAGLLMGRVQGHTLHATLDFVLPQFRDFKVGRYLFEEQAPFFRERGITEIVGEAAIDEHAAYLRRMGFVADATPGARPLYRLRLA